MAGKKDIAELPVRAKTAQFERAAEEQKAAGNACYDPCQSRV